MANLFLSSFPLISMIPKTGEREFNTYECISHSSLRILFNVDLTPSHQLQRTQIISLVQVICDNQSQPYTGSSFYVGYARMRQFPLAR
jgi:hypothetical protein